jgi:hypothetical protein
VGRDSLPRGESPDDQTLDAVSHQFLLERPREKLAGRSKYNRYILYNIDKRLMVSVLIGANVVRRDNLNADTHSL